MPHTAPLLRPAGRFATTPQPLRLRESRDENYRIKSLIFDGEMPEARPGQFVMAWLPRRDEKPFSLADNIPLTLTVAAVGPFTEALHAMKPGDTLWFRGPYGLPFESVGRRPALVGGGYGAAPLAWLASEQRARGQQPIVLLGGRTGADIFGLEPFDRMQIPYILSTDDGSRGEAGVIATPVRRLLANGEVDSLCGVGPHGLLEALVAMGREFGVPTQLSWEGYMGCAIGLCGLCEHSDGSLLCVEGPVRQQGRA